MSKSTNVTQVATFEKLVGHCNAQAAMYNPPKDSLKVTAMSHLLDAAKKSVQAVNELSSVYSKAVGERSQAFDELPKFMTRLINALKAADVPVTTINEASRYKKRLQTRIKTIKQKGAPDDAANGDPPIIKTTRAHSTYDHQIAAFETLMKFIATEPAYVTTNPALTIEGMGAFRDTLQQKNKAVLDAFVALSASRKTRDKILFAKDGIYSTGMAVKFYFRSILGTQNASAKEVSKMFFFTKKAAMK
jgi:hypothetical protein